MCTNGQFGCKCFTATVMFCFVLFCFVSACSKVVGESLFCIYTKTMLICVFVLEQSKFNI